MTPREPVGRTTTLLVALAVSACGVFTARARDVVQSKALEDLSCADAVVAVESDGTYRATGCGGTRRYVCDRSVATAVSKPGAIAAVGCRPAPDVATGSAPPQKP
jgi:hypothetical protein